MKKYENFKHLLEYFVAHLEWCVNENTSFRGYQTYIKPLKDAKSFTKTGRGYNGDTIQNQIAAWENYNNGRICITVVPNYGNYQAVTSYLNWEGTAINVRAIWKQNEVTGLKIVTDSYPANNAKDIVSYTIQNLGLFDNNSPNQNLKDFFNKFYSLKTDWNTKKHKEVTMKKIQPYIDLLKSSKNLIFTGAPGTGKTYLAKQIAKIMTGISTDDELEKSGQFAFVQFHPSYDYTDFVEGLRPTAPDENGIIGFELKNGIFKNFCKKALKNLMDSEKTLDELQNESNIETILDNFLEDSIENEKKFDYKNNSNQFIIIPHPKKEECFYAKILNNESMERQLVFKKDVIEVLKQSNDIQKPTDIQKLFNTRFKYQYTFIFLILEQLRDKLKGQKNEELKETIKKKDFIFVIDEINRGEISKIFGELFFSIDPSYRGKKGAVKTQYANMHENEESFYVPENVYIIGTMNDIDRSVESFDFAMRRRFVWVEISAENSAETMSLSNKTIQQMKKLNNAISSIEGLNSSYHIGGAYFLDSEGKPREDYSELWKQRIEPLLKEYLRGMPECDKKLEELKTAFTLDANNR